MARDFENGSSNYITFGTTNVPTTGDFTVVGVVKPENVTTYHTLISNTDIINGWGVGHDPSGNPFLVKYGVAVIASSGITVSGGSTYALAYKVDVSTDVKFFRKQIGGATSTNTQANTSAINAPTPGVNIGAKGTGADFMDGIVANVAVYDGLLADGLIEHLMNMALSGHWGEMRVDGCQFLAPLIGTATEPDYSGNANNSSTISGAVYAPLSTGTMFASFGWKGATGGGAVATTPLAYRPLLLSGVGA